MKRDVKRREKLARVDDEHRSSRVSKTRSFIYEKGYGVKSTAVEKMLSSKSEVPTTVS